MEAVTNLKTNEFTINAGREVLKTEAQCLINLANSLDETFAEAVDVIYNLSSSKGRVIVTGMGKSGHIGAKIAATLASTGTPSFTVHPGEASHGDLGMITEDDVIIAFSHSGETKELGDIIAHCHRFNIPLIAITGNKTSTLGAAANICLVNGVTKEACPINLAPTSSTTTTLALGDALAVALMHRRGFKPEDFANFHPGGKLGSKLSTVSTLMETNIPLVEITSKMETAILEITEKGLGVVGITGENNTLVGIITDGDLRRHIGDDIMQKPVKEVMSSSPKTVPSDMLASHALRLMQENEITSLFVIENNKPVGIIHIRNCLRVGVI